MMGKVFIIGAGPGDPELITVKGLRALEESDVILHDALVDKRIFDLIDLKNREVIFVGKRKGDGNGGQRQGEINQLMLRFVLEGKTVARLKGGDPGVFGRLADEIEFLEKHGIPYQIIPGVSSFNGVASSAGIPLTKKGISALTLLSGTEKLSLETLISGTFVVMMAREAIENVAKRLIEMGLSPDKPAVAIENGTLDNQRIVSGTLKDIHEKVGDFSGPTLIIIGDVAALKP